MNMATCLLVSSTAEARRRDTGIAGAAGAVVVAHLDGGGEPAPFRPVERGVDRQLPEIGRKAKETAVVHLGRAHDLARIEQTLGERRP